MGDRYIVAITGASGAVYGLRLVGELLRRDLEVELLISGSGHLILKEEAGLDTSVEGGTARAVREYLKVEGKVEGGRLTYHDSGDLTSSVASGSSMRRSMILMPTSMGSLARIATGVSTNLIERAADCVLKERGELILVPRETPLSSIHLENMLKLSQMGAVIVPAMPAFYTKPETVDDMVNFVVGKVLDLLRIEHTLYPRWKA